MIKKKQLKQIKLASVVPMLLLGLANPAIVQAAQTAQPINNSPANTRTLLNQQFPDNGEPTGRSRGGASRRDGCPELKIPLTALVPSDKTKKTSFMASTVAEYPTFWVYVPELPTNVNSGEFVLQDEAGNDVWRTAISLPGKSGAIAISLPSNPQYALKQNDPYHWYFRVYCGEAGSKPEYFYVDAWVKRLPLTPELQRQLQSAKPKEYTAYTANHLWHDALTNLAQLRRINPGDRSLASDWNNLLKSAGLEELANTPIVQSYTSQK